MTAAQAREPALGTGIGLRACHHAAVMTSPPRVGFLEIHAENYLGGGSARRCLDRARRDHPVSVHGVGLSLGSAEGLDDHHLARIARLVREVEPMLVSEHLAWSVAGGVYHNDLLPLPYTEESLEAVCANVQRLQEALGRRVLVENPSTYLRFAGSAIPEEEFLLAVAARTGCGLLLDVNNVHVTATNHGLDAAAYIERLAGAPVGEIHLAGHHVTEADGVPILIDDHGSAVSDAVWALYARAARLFPQAPGLVEWDSSIPALDVLVAEAHRADAVREVTHAVAA